jgi:signal transduction histidine kinase
MSMNRGDAPSRGLYGYTTRESGTGFGLSIVRRLGTAHGRSVALTESGDGGARCEFET